jgi:hypothetical protein
VSAIRPIKPLLQGLIDSAFTLLVEQDHPDEFLGDVINTPVNNVLNSAKGLDKEDAGDYTQSLGDVAKLALRLLTLLGLAACMIPFNLLMLSTGYAFSRLD